MRVFGMGAASPTHTLDLRNTPPKFRLPSQAACAFPAQLPGFDGTQRGFLSLI